jgi:Putative membrane protein insertion efficiency factor
VPDNDRDPGGDPAEDESARRRRKRREDASWSDLAEGVPTGTGSGGTGGRPGGGRGDGWGDCGTSACGGSGGSGRGGDGCDGPCDCNASLLLRLSTALLVVSAVMPAWGSGRLVQALIRGYQRWLTRYTPACPSNPSCSAYALAAVGALGPRRGLAAAALRIKGCGT